MFIGMNGPELFQRQPKIAAQSVTGCINIRDDIVVEELSE
jgi:hypothetical protein